MSKYPIELFHDVVIAMKELEVYYNPDLIISSIELVSRLDSAKNTYGMFYNEIEEASVGLSSSVETAIERITNESDITDLGYKFLYSNPDTSSRMVLCLAKDIYDATAVFLKKSEDKPNTPDRECLQMVSRELYRYCVTGNTDWFGKGTRKPEHRFIPLEDAINSTEHSIGTLEKVKNEYLLFGDISKDKALYDYIKLLENKINTKKYLSTINSINEFRLSTVKTIVNYLDKLEEINVNDIAWAEDTVSGYGRMLRSLLRDISKTKIGE